MSLQKLKEVTADNLRQPFNEPFKEKLKYLLIDSRATLIRRDYGRFKNFTTSLIDEIKFAEVEDVNLAECLGIPGLEVKAKRTKSKIPHALRIVNWTPSEYIYVGDPRMYNREGSFSLQKFGYRFVERNEVLFQSANRFSKDIPSYTIIDDQFYLFNANAKRINISGCFANPLELNKVGACQSVSCEPDDFYIPEELWDGIIKLTYEKLNLMPKDDEIEFNKEKDGNN